MKEKIIAKAKEMFLRLGFKSITMDDIACEMCISKKTIYKYFSNKDILIEESIKLAHIEINETIDKIVAQDLNAIEENFEIKRMFKEMFKSSETSPIYQLKKHYPEIYNKVLGLQIEVCIKCFKDNILKGMKEGLYRKNLDVDNYVKFYYTLIFNINENTALEIEAQELELKALEYHIRAMATLAGIVELEKQLKTQIIY
ncbi:TetR/AcrR family transcriptional regulator [Flavobacterium tibetense]|uniref:TetR/AcrR family transcriptional regulator n=1 Tax=Flavobacterium tibetense TaxID=2233533 RepID=A0A365P5K0_9FLAO|nr:TetR/AcrR family transcriptional regulator [Flavobacterium tibetense]RBA29870.1 TetR/AcrR family transcriptional regulator [Flavobacterium tibetense]